MFFFKQKTAYEMRISDWSSDVCSSDLPWMWLGFDIGLGPAADRPLSVWQESFVPMRLADALREVDGSNGQPLVLAEEQILPHRIAPEPAETSQIGSTSCRERVWQYV